MRVNRRGLGAILLFAVFGIGGVGLIPVFLLVWSRAARQEIMRTLWRIFVWMLNRSGLIRIDRGELRPWRGTILACNHPSLLDVVAITAFVPKTLFIAKNSLRNNLCCAASVRALSLPADADLVAEATPRLAAGWNVLIFPEGTRSPGTDRMRPFKRGCAQLALRTGAPVVCLGARYSRRVLGKGQSVWDMGTRCMQATFRADAPQTFRVQPGENLHHAAMRVTEALESRITRLVLDDAREEGIGAPGAGGGLYPPQEGNLPR